VVQQDHERNLGNHDVVTNSADSHGPAWGVQVVLSGVVGFVLLLVQAMTSGWSVALLASVGMVAFSVYARYRSIRATPHSSATDNATAARRLGAALGWAALAIVALILVLANLLYQAGVW